MQEQDVIVVGSGIGGIATSIRLACKGYRVRVMEANSYPGGKLSSFSMGHFRFDSGPSLFTMPQFVEELFVLAGKDPKAYFEYIKKEIVCNYFYEDGTRFSAHANSDKFVEESAAVFDVDERDVRAYLSKSKQKYDLTSSIFLEKSLHKLKSYLNAATIKAIIKINSLDINKTLHEVNASVFKDSRLVQLFDRYATYNGSSPYLTPGIMSMIPHLEQYYGTFFPKGGMQSITNSLYQLAKDLGVVFEFNQKVDEIIVENKMVKGVRVGNKDYLASRVVSNADVVPTYRYLLKKQKAPEKILAQERSSSALIFYWGINRTFDELDLHNIFFTQDYQQEFSSIFKEKTVGEDPTVYINITSKNELTDAPDGSENWFVMINVPSNEGQDWDQIIVDARRNVQKKLSRILNTNIEDCVVCEEILDPRSIESKTQSYQGALYGASSNDKYAAFLRHPNFTKNIKGLYFCGGSVHPGGGIPLCLLSAQIVADLIPNK